MEQWMLLQDYPRYAVSDEGRVRNERTGSIVAIGRSSTEHAFVKLWDGDKQVSRALAVLVATAFVPLPPHRCDTPTPIHLDGDFMNCRADNLVWRPRWFAQRYTAQFRKNLDNPNAIRNIDTGVEYATIWDVVFEQGVLFNDVLKSIINKTYVFPLYQCFEWVDPD